MTIPLRLLGIFFAMATLLLGGCVTGERMQEVRPGMSQAQVESILGRPEGFKVSGEFTVFTYKNRLISGWSWDRADFHVILKDDAVVETGSGEVRERNPNMSTHTIFLYTY